jgi:cytochrome c oxidase subunit 3
MKRDFSQELSPEIREKTKKNLVYVGIFSIVMMFGGLTSAYIVSMGDTFWMKYPLPKAFFISTAVIILSSVFLELAIRFVKKGNQKMLKLFVSLTLIGGIGFVYFQFQGYKQLTNNGIHAVNNHIIVTDGKYGDYYEVKYKGSFLEVDGNRFIVNKKDLTETEMKSYQDFMSQFLNVTRNKSMQVSNYGSNFILYYENQPLALIKGKLYKSDGQEIQYVDQLRLQALAINVRDGRGDFFAKGEIGKDFQIYFKGKELQYKNRDLLFNGKKLSKYLQIKAMETADTGTTYLYLITFLHLLHILVTLIYMSKMTIASFSGSFTAVDHIRLKVGAIFWHFLGLLWIYLLLFLLFIH